MRGERGREEEGERVGWEEEGDGSKRGRERERNELGGGR